MNKIAVLEGALFIVGEEGLNINQVIKLLDIDIKEAKTLLEELVTQYEKDHRGITMALYGNNFKLTTKPEHKSYYQKLIEVKGSRELSTSALETLVIVAYNEPITRLKVDKLRGVSSVHIIRKLLAEDLLQEIGREDSPGRPILYQTSSDFLDYFGLTSLDELPKIVDKKPELNEEKDLFN